MEHHSRAPIFAIEVLTIGRMSYTALIPCLMASIVGDQVNTAWGVGHTQYQVAWATSASETASSISLDWKLTGKVAIAAGCFGLTSVLFVELMHGISEAFKRTISIPWLRPAVGGMLLILLTLALRDQDYLGLGEFANPQTPDAVTIQSCFSSAERQCSAGGGSSSSQP